MYYPILGIFNSAKGTIVGCVFQSNSSYDYSLDILDSNGNAKEIPIVLVKMDDNIGFSICTNMPNVIPFGEMCDDYIKY